MGKWRKGKTTDYMLEFPSIAYWMSQLRDSGVKNSDPKRGTKIIYLLQLQKFNEWLTGREFDVRIQTVENGNIVQETQRRSFVNVEELLRFGEKWDGNTKDIKKIVSQYIVEPMHDNLSNSSMTLICAAIKSYFTVHDVIVNIKWNGRTRDDIEVTDDPELTLPEFYKMMVAIRGDHTVRAVMMVKFQAGLDRSTLADRFNYQAYAQISKFCGTTNHSEWNLDKCPIPIRLVRVKTGVPFTTFIDRDALSAIKDYLSWREKTKGPHNQDGPLFLTNQNTPIAIDWISLTFAKLAKYSQVQKNISPYKNKIRSHEVRDLLKTTLMVCGCPEHMADSIIGHKPKDSYVKISKLYPLYAIH